VEISFQLETRQSGKMAGIHFTTQEKQRIAIFNQFIVSALTHWPLRLNYTYWVHVSASRSCTTPKIRYYKDVPLDVFP
jgi:hypothetical protein